MCHRKEGLHTTYLKAETRRGSMSSSLHNHMEASHASTTTTISPPSIRAACSMISATAYHQVMVMGIDEARQLFLAGMSSPS